MIAQFILTFTHPRHDEVTCLHIHIPIYAAWIFAFYIPAISSRAIYTNYNFATLQHTANAMPDAKAASSSIPWSTPLKERQARKPWVPDNRGVRSEIFWSVAIARDSILVIFAAAIGSRVSHTHANLTLTRIRITERLSASRKPRIYINRDFKFVFLPTLQMKESSLRAASTYWTRTLLLESEACGSRISFPLERSNQIFVTLYYKSFTNKISLFCYAKFFYQEYSNIRFLIEMKNPKGNSVAVGTWYVVDTLFDTEKGRRQWLEDSRRALVWRWLWLRYHGLNNAVSLAQ